MNLVDMDNNVHIWAALVWALKNSFKLVLLAIEPRRSEADAQAFCARKHGLLLP